jgi:hypothetical protein
VRGKWFEVNDLNHSATDAPYKVDKDPGNVLKLNETGKFVVKQLFKCNSVHIIFIKLATFLNSCKSHFSIILNMGLGEENRIKLK